MLLAAGALVAVLLAITLVALEGGEVVVVRTLAAAGTGEGPVDGAWRQTRTWIADADGAAWVEAADESRLFLADLRRLPVARLRRGRRDLTCRAAIWPNPGGHRRIRELLRARYGWKDRWIGLIASTHGSVAIRLDCR